jgi:hypothetical protein
VTTICTEDLGRYAGVGLSLEQVIEEELRNVGAAPQCPVEKSDDLAIWEGNKIAALIRIGAAGQPVVTRFDRTAEDQDTPGSAKGSIPASNTQDLSRSGPGPSPHAPAVSEIRAAIAHFETLRRIAEDVLKRCREAVNPGTPLTPPDARTEFWQRWSCVVRELQAVSEQHLCRAIENLALEGGDVVRQRDGRRRSTHLGVIVDGRLYLAQDGGASKNLAVVDLKNVCRLDTDTGRKGAPTEIP